MKVPFRTRWKLLRKAAVGLLTGTSAEDMLGLLEGSSLSASSSTFIRGSRSLLQAYSEMPWLRAVASRIAFSVASVEWKLFVLRESGSGGRRVVGGPAVKTIQRMADVQQRKQYIRQKQLNGELEEITEHPFLDVMNRGNSLHVGLTVRKLIVLYLDIAGQCFLLKERNQVGAPVGLWPVPPHWVVSVPSPSNPYYELQVGSWRRRTPDTEVLWMNDADPFNPYQRGVGQAESVADELEIDTFASKMAKQVFFNRGRPDFVVMPKEGSMLKTDTSRLERYWLDRIQGFWNVAKPLFFPRPVEVKEFSNDFRNFEFTDLRKYQRDVVMQVFGIPPEVMGVLTNSNRATIEASDFLMAKYVVTPRLEFIRSQFQERLVPEYDDRLILDYVSPIEEDHEFKLKAMLASPSTVRVNEWRELQGLDPLEGPSGDLHMVSMNQFTVGDLQDLSGSIGRSPSGQTVGVSVQHLTDEELRMALELSKKIYEGGGA